MSNLKNEPKETLSLDAGVGCLLVCMGVALLGFVGAISIVVRDYNCNQICKPAAVKSSTIVSCECKDE